MKQMNHHEATKNDSYTQLRQNLTESKPPPPKRNYYIQMCQIWGQKDNLVELERLLLNALSALANKIKEENKLHFFQSPLRDEAIEYW